MFGPRSHEVDQNHPESIDSGSGVTSGPSSAGISIGSIAGNSVVVGNTVVIGGGVVTTTASEVVTGIVVETGIVDEATAVDEGIESVEDTTVDVASVEERVEAMEVNTEVRERPEVVTVCQERD